MKDRWMRFLKWCEKTYNDIVGWNRTMLGETMPEALAKMPLYMALPAWLVLSVAWIVPMGVLTLAVEMLLFPFLMIEDCVSHAHQNVIEVLKSVGGVLIWGLIMLGLFIMCRLEAPVALFQDGILEPRQEESRILAA